MGIVQVSCPTLPLEEIMGYPLTHAASPQPAPAPGQPAWNPLRRLPPAGSGADRPGGPPARVVYVLRDAAHAAAAALATPHRDGSWGEDGVLGEQGEWEGLLRHCAQAGCLMSHALEHLAGGASGGGGGEAKEVTALRRFADGGAEFLLIQSHFAGWAEAARAGKFQAIPYIEVAPHAQSVDWARL